MNMNRKEHWEKVYNTKQLTEVSWYQPIPTTSLGFITELRIAKDAAIIDVGGGDSFLVDSLLDKGFTDITVLDISEAAINRAKKRLGTKAEKVNWIIADITEFRPMRQYDCWHDRAAFHFLTTEEETSKYLSIANSALKQEGKLIIGTFSVEGPQKCSGLYITQYSEKSLPNVIRKWFDKIKCISTKHITPSNAIQDFLFCSFKKHQPVLNGI